MNNAPGFPEAGEEPEEYDGSKDDEIINKLLSGDPTGNLDVYGYGDTVGKVDDAVDYEDISDDDLPSEEDAPHPRNDGIQGATGGDDGGAAGRDEFDDLFGDMEEPPFGGADSVMVDPGALDVDMGLDFSSEHDIDIPDDAQLMVPTASQGSLFRNIDFGVAPPEPEVVRKEPTREELLKLYFPDFKPHSILSFNEIFKPKPATLSVFPPKTPKALIPTKVSVEYLPDDEVLFNKPTSARVATREDRRGAVVVSPIEGEGSDLEEEDGDELVDFANMTEFDKRLMMACNDWESKVDEMMKRDDTTPPSSPRRRPYDQIEEEDEDLDTRSPKRLKLLGHYIDALPDSWLSDQVILEGNLSVISNKVNLDLNDPYLMIDIRQPNEVRPTRRIGGEFKRRVNKDLTQRYNISNDEAYDLLKGNMQNKVRSAIGQLEIEHTMPALRLQSPYYKTKLSIKEARSFHRPGLHFINNFEIRFSKIRPRKKKTYRGKDVKTVLATTKDLSLMDNCNFILLEYSEEYPFVMSNFGMGSRLINYYRRKGPDDEARPKCEIGETQVLMSQDRSPFWNFGTVDPGETVPTLYNNMVRAPIFKQTPKQTDFLVIRNTHDNQSHYFLRNIPNLFVVGQLLPVTDVPGPHSRKVTTAAKNRLKMVCYRVVKRKPEKAIILKDIAAHFPENNEMRQKMKEFMSYNKPKGVWEMNAGEVVPDESVIRTMVKPEDLCLLEAMQVGVRNLADSGYSKTVDDENEDEEKEGMSLEQQLTPWVSTKNFINATSGKAMLQLHGEGDPSGRGEAFSFVKTSMKGGFKAVGESVEEKMDKQRLKELGGHAYNVARQQKMYEEAIDRIWRAQYRSLSSMEEPEMHDVEIEDANRDEHMEDLFDEGRTPRSEAVPQSPWLNNVDGDETMSQFSKFSATNRRDKVLRIQRRVLGPGGEMENKVEVIRDPKVIRQYLRRRREIEAEKTQVENLVPTGNEDEDQLSRKRLVTELKRLERNKERREARERDKGKRTGSFLGGGDAMSPESAPTPGSPMPPATASAPATTGATVIGKATTARKCKNCGLVGHIRTNKKVCPKLNGQWAEMGMSPPDGNTPMAAAGTPGP